MYRSVPLGYLVRSAGWLLAALAACWSSAWAQGAPHLGYAYPAGGKQGSVVRVTVGGQFLRDPQYVHVSGGGVTGRVLQHIRPLNNQELGRIRLFLRNMVKLGWDARTMAAVRAQAGDTPPLPDHPWLWDLNEKSPAEIARLRASLFDPKKQPNAQIAEQVEMEINIAPGAEAGDRELQLVTANGLTNPVCFQVGRLPEVREEDVISPGNATAPVGLPAVLNGQILPGEVDRYRLRARAGQRLLVRVQARHLVPYLADAVPGWFQAVVALYDAQGKEVGYNDDYRFDPDPVLFYQVPQDGEYTLEIRDALYRGREDFVYRISVGELPFVTHLYPLGGQAGTPTVASLAGWNLPTQTLPLDTRPDGDRLRFAAVNPDPGLTSKVIYAVDSFPESAEREPNDDAAHPQQVTIPQVLNGRFDRPGDVDVYGFEGRAGEEVVAEVWARRLGSPADAALRVVDAAGNTVAVSDDHDDAEMGLLTHHADPYLRVKLLADGTYRVRLYEVQHHGADDYVYRFYLRPPQPDFALRVTPASLSMPFRRPASATVHAIRKDGFDGDIDIVLKEAPPGVVLGPARIPGGKDSVQVRLTAVADVPLQVAPLRLEGRAQIGGAVVTRPVVPAEEMMQAFAYQHLVPQQELLVAVTGVRTVPAVWRPLVPGISLPQGQPVLIPLGGTAEVRFTAPSTLPDRQRTPLTALEFALCAAPPGMRLVATRTVAGGVALTFKADANCAALGEAGYLLVEAFAEPSDGPPAGSAGMPRQRVSVGVLPAIPFQVVRAGR